MGGSERQKSYFIQLSGGNDGVNGRRKAAIGVQVTILTGWLRREAGHGVLKEGATAHSPRGPHGLNLWQDEPVNLVQQGKNTVITLEVMKWMRW